MGLDIYLAEKDPAEDPVVIEAILNIKASIRNIALMAEWTANPLLSEALDDLEQALRYLEGKEKPE